MLSVYTRHYLPCVEHNPYYRDCFCPKWISGTVPGRPRIRSAPTPVVGNKPSAVPAISRLKLKIVPFARSRRLRPSGVRSRPLSPTKEPAICRPQPSLKPKDRLNDNFYPGVVSTGWRTWKTLVAARSWSFATSGFWLPPLHGANTKASKAFFCSV